MVKPCEIVHCSFIMQLTISIEGTVTVLRMYKHAVSQVFLSASISWLRGGRHGFQSRAKATPGAAVVFTSNASISNVIARKQKTLGVG